MTRIALPHGAPGAGFDATDLKDHMLKKNIRYMIQGQQACTLANHTKPHSLDYWLRTQHAGRRDTKQAVNSVIEQVVSTGIFYQGHFICPDSGRMCKGIALHSR